MCNIYIYIYIYANMVANAWSPDVKLFCNVVRKDDGSKIVKIKSELDINKL